MSNYALRVPDSLLNRARILAEQDHTSMNQLIVTAIAEKLASLETETLLMERAEKVDIAEFRKILKRVPARPITEPGDVIESK